MTVLGIDLSLTSTGLALVGPAASPAALTALSFDHVGETGKLSDTLVQRRDRLVRLRDNVLSWSVAADLVVIEQPSYGSTGSGTHDRSGVWWLVVERLIARGVPVAEVPSNLVAQYATGVGRAGRKAAIVSAATRRYAHLLDDGQTFETDDEADALVLAAMGCRHLGHPIERSLPAVNAAAVGKVRWPESLGGA